MMKAGEKRSRVMTLLEQALASGNVSPSTADGVKGLVQRFYALNSLGRRLGWSLLAASTILLLVAVLVMFSGPDASLGAPDIPDLILDRLKGSISDAAGQTGTIGQLASSFDNNMESLIARIPFGGIGIVAFGLSLLASLLTRTLFPVIGGGVIAMMLGGLMPLLIDGVAEISPQSLSPKDAFIQAVEDLDYDGTRALLSGVQLEETPSGAYLLAQVSLAKEKANGKPDASPPESHALPQQIKKAVEPQRGFMPDGQVLYALESTVLGKSVSAPAQAYEKLKQGHQASIATLRDVLCWLVGVLLALQLGFIGLHRIVSTRLFRILRELAPKAPMGKHEAGLSGSKFKGL